MMGSTFLRIRALWGWPPSLLLLGAVLGAGWAPSSTGAEGGIGCASRVIHLDVCFLGGGGAGGGRKGEVKRRSAPLPNMVAPARSSWPAVWPTLPLSVGSVLFSWDTVSL